MSPLADALDAIRREDAAFADVLTELYTAKYTGTVTLHVADGIARVIEFPGRQVRLQATRLDFQPNIADSQ